MAADSLEKEKLRKLYLKKRKDLPTEEVNNKSKIITNELLNRNEYKSARVIHTYIPIKKNNEVDTFVFINKCFETGKKVIVPKVVNSNQLHHYQVNSLNHFDKNKWDIPEPSKGKIIPVHKIDLVIVPMVAGDYFKNRIGYGKGYYDRFLNECNARTIGLLFNCQLHDGKLPTEHFDIPLDILITESEIIQ